MTLGRRPTFVPDAGARAGDAGRGASCCLARAVPAAGAAVHARLLSAQGIAARQRLERLHRRQVPLRLDEGRADRLDAGIAADLRLIVDDLAAALDHVEDDADVVRVAVPGAGAGVAQDMRLDLVGGEDGKAGGEALLRIDTLVCVFWLSMLLCVVRAWMPS